jgi:hypothetical protein
LYNLLLEDVTRMELDRTRIARVLRRSLVPAFVALLLLGVFRIPAERGTVEHELVGNLRSLAWAQRTFHGGNGRYFSDGDLATTGGRRDLFRRGLHGLGYALEVRVLDGGRSWEALAWDSREVWRVTSVPVFSLSRAALEGPVDGAPDPDALDWGPVDTTLY